MNIPRTTAEDSAHVLSRKSFDNADVEMDDYDYDYDYDFSSDEDDLNEFKHAAVETASECFRDFRSNAPTYPRCRIRTVTPPAYDTVAEHNEPMPPHRMSVCEGEVSDVVSHPPATGTDAPGQDKSI